MKYLYLYVETAAIWTMDTPPTLLDRDKIAKGILEVFSYNGEFSNSMPIGRQYQNDEGRPYSFLNMKG